MSDELTVSNPCYQCMIQMELCIDCQDLRDSRATNIAHDMVDEANLIYPAQWHSITEPSGHEWVSPTTRVEPYFVYATQTWEDTREEYTAPIVQLVDGGVLDNLWELEDYTQYMRETQCQWCNLLTPKMFNDCQVCDKPLENNL